MLGAGRADGRPAGLNHWTLPSWAFCAARSDSTTATSVGGRLAAYVACATGADARGRQGWISTSLQDAAMHIDATTHEHGPSGKVYSCEADYGIDEEAISDQPER